MFCDNSWGIYGNYSLGSENVILWSLYRHEKRLKLCMFYKNLFWKYSFCFTIFSINKKLKWFKFEGMKIRIKLN